MKWLRKLRLEILWRIDRYPRGAQLMYDGIHSENGSQRRCWYVGKDFSGNPRIEFTRPGYTVVVGRETLRTPTTGELVTS